MINREVFTLQGKILLNNHLFIEFNTTNYRKSINYTFGSETALHLLFDKVIEDNFKEDIDIRKRTLFGLFDWLWVSIHERHIGLLDDFIIMVLEPTKEAHQINIQPEMKCY